MRFADPAEHLAAELQRLDLVLHREIVRLRAAYQLSLDEFRGLYVSDEQVDRLAGNALRIAQQVPAGALAVLRDGAQDLLFELRAHARQLA